MRHVAELPVRILGWVHRYLHDILTHGGNRQAVRGLNSAKRKLLHFDPHGVSRRRGVPVGHSLESV